MPATRPPRVRQDCTDPNSVSLMAPDILMGYATFVISILGIGVVTAVIGDLASHLGCTIGLKDTVTAIGFVALGTSVPGTAKG